MEPKLGSEIQSKMKFNTLVSVRIWGFSKKNA